jgi:anthranilate phosphoribosyltransferase
MTAITPQQALQRVIESREIFHDEMLHLMRQIMAGEVSPPMVAAILAGLRVKKETIGEIAAAATVMRELATKVEVADKSAFVDVVGTGGDGAHTFNISTASIFVVAAAGGKVAKHGGRSVSSSSGSADALEALGANIMLKPEQVAECIQATGIGFMFAPNHHSAMKNVAPIRKEMGVRTIFNILGPLTNPAGAPNTLMGVFHPDLVGIQVRVMQRLGANHVLIVHGRDGMDEISKYHWVRLRWLANSRTVKSASTKFILKTSGFPCRRVASCALPTPMNPRPCCWPPLTARRRPRCKLRATL